MDPRVTQELVDMGFHLSQIQHVLTNKTYNYMMATYLMLKRKAQSAVSHYLCETLLFPRPQEL